VAGAMPRNFLSGALTVPLPWFGVEGVAATKRACPELAEEAAFFAALERMTLAEVAGSVLILSNDAGEEMVFRAE